MAGAKTGGARDSLLERRSKRGMNGRKKRWEKSRERETQVVFADGCQARDEQQQAVMGEKMYEELTGTRGRNRRGKAEKRASRGNGAVALGSFASLFELPGVRSIGIGWWCCATHDGPGERNL
ncbi:hypothetical protein R1sor_015760 [Riccia sorocarpa]|uniref:Uncharacterized protein n=1 Tax=Riccia sorocarpa TaxID=122646 RepID=A0ABD3HF25_9MARC